MAEFVRYRKLTGKDHRFCIKRQKKVILGKGQDDGDIAYFEPSKVPSSDDKTWKCLDGEPEEVVAEQDIDEPIGVLEIVDAGAGWFNVRNTATGENINTAKLRRDKAEALVDGWVDEETEAEETEAEETEAEETE